MAAYSTCRFLILSLMLVLGWSYNAGAADHAAWSALEAGGNIVFIRHSLTESGIGDPEGFDLKNCRTQRNLSAKGKENATALGAEFRRRQIPVADVLSSHWCRCVDTATLAFGNVKPATMLDSMFNDPGQRTDADKMRALHAFVAQYRSPGNLILVTHAQNIQNITGISPASLEMVVTKFDGKDFKVIGRIPAP